MTTKATLLRRGARLQSVLTLWGEHSLSVGVPVPPGLVAAGPPRSILVRAARSGRCYFGPFPSGLLLLVQCLCLAALSPLLVFHSW